VDLSAAMIAEAKKKLGNGADLRVGRCREPSLGVRRVRSCRQGPVISSLPESSQSHFQHEESPQGRWHTQETAFPLRQVFNCLLVFIKEGHVQICSKGKIEQKANEVGFVDIHSKVNFIFQFLTARVSDKSAATI
jgi:hypothetical protein